MEFSYYNAAVYLIGRNLLPSERPVRQRSPLSTKAACTRHAELAERVDRCANVLRELGIQPEQRVLLCLYDSIDFPACFLGATEAGIVPVPINTMWSASDYAYVLSDSRAQAAIVSEERLPAMLEAAQISGWAGRIVVAGKSHSAHQTLRLMAASGSCRKAI